MSFGRVLKNLRQPTDLLVTPKIESFLMRNPDGPVWDAEALEVWKGLVTRSTDNHDRTNRFGTSQRGKCKRAQVFSFLGMPDARIPDPEVQMMYLDGTWRHLRWQMLGIQSGALTHVEYPVEMKKYRLKTKLDGINTHEGFLFELKGDRNWGRTMEDVPRDHLLQMHTAMWMTGWDRCVYVVEGKSSQQWREVVVDRDPELIAEVRHELEELNGYVEDRRLPSVLPACASKEGPYRTCRFGPECLRRAREGDYYPADPDWAS